MFCIKDDSRSLIQVAYTYLPFAVVGSGYARLTYEYHKLFLKYGTKQSHLNQHFHCKVGRQNVIWPVPLLPMQMSVIWDK